MRTVPSRLGCTRAILGVIALYALLLQSFLMAGTPRVLAGPIGLLCSHDAPDAPAGGIPVPHQHDCCTTAQGSAPLAPPVLAAIVTWAPTASQSIVWRPEAWIPRTGPSTNAQSPRGPPLA